MHLRNERPGLMMAEACCSWPMRESRSCLVQTLRLRQLDRRLDSLVSLSWGKDTVIRAVLRVNPR